MRSSRNILGATLLALAGAATGYSQSNGPVRMARVSYITGKADWRSSSGADWSPAVQNLPVREGDQIWAPSGSRTEIQFDDGSTLRLAGGGHATLSSLYSDSNGEFTNIKLNEGVAYLRVRHPYSVYQIDTPSSSIRVDGPTKIKIWAGGSTQVADQLGTVQIQGSRGKVALHAGDDIAFLPDGSYRSVTPAVDAGWDRFNDSRDQVLERPDPYVPQNIALVSGELTDYGNWREEPRYGHVWYPRHSDRSWRPYHNGRWTWVDPVGWTWVGNEPWGWAPYHYGTWVNSSYGWGWVPGPRNQYWSPAVVSYTQYNDQIAWAPLDPGEVRYPAALTLGFHSGDWSVFFSIGGVGAYYASNSSYCEARPFDNGYVNGRFDSFRTVNITNNYVNRGFVPVNSSRYAGASFTSRAGFGGQGSYQALGTNGANLFRRGRSFAPPTNGALRAGATFVRPSRIAMTPTRSFASAGAIPHAVATRAVFHAANWSAPATAFNRNAGRAQPLAPRSTASRMNVPNRGNSANVGQAGRLQNRAAQTHPGQNRPVQANPAMNAQQMRDRQAAARARAAIGYHAPKAGSFGSRNPAQANPRTAAATRHAPVTGRNQSAGSIQARTPAHRPTVNHASTNRARPTQAQANRPAVRRPTVARPAFRAPVQHHSQPVQIRRTQSRPPTRQFQTRQSQPRQSQPRQAQVRRPQTRQPQQRMPQQRAPQGRPAQNRRQNPPAQHQNKRRGGG